MLRYCAAIIALIMVWPTLSDAQTEPKNLPMVFMPSDPTFNPQRAINNYKRIRNNEIDISALSKEELKEVYYYLEAIAVKPPNDASEECLKHWRDAESASSTLKSELSYFQSCIDKDDYKDDCEHEFNNVGNARERYQQASQSVSAECN